MPVDDGGQGLGQVAVWFDAVQFACLDQRGKDSPVLGTCLMAYEEAVLAAQSDWADGSLDGIGIHLDPTVSQEQDHTIPVFGDVFESLTGGRFGRDLQSGMIER